MNDVARHLLSSETTGQGNSMELAYATERVCQRLRIYLSRLLGSDGSATLLRRSLKLSQGRFARLQTVKLSDGRAFAGLVETVQELEPGVTLEMCIALIESFLTLFASLVGEDLARKLVEEALTTGSESATGGDNS